MPATDNRERDVDNIRILVKYLEETLSLARSLLPPEAGHDIGVPPSSVGDADEDIQVGSRVAITWDRDWRWNRPKKHMPKTKNEGCHGTVVRTTKCYVWVKLNGTGKELQKCKHNVTILK